jgi:hypothetical protein
MKIHSSTKALLIALIMSRGIVAYDAPKNCTHVTCEIEPLSKKAPDASHQHFP